MDGEKDPEIPCTLTKRSRIDSKTWDLLKPKSLKRAKDYIYLSRAYKRVVNLVC
tara:strand:- start:1774 stop:1935 length:162 start_codon:yes stop_codon:yes gene_type:complete